MKNLFLTLIVTLFVSNGIASAKNEEPKVVLVKTSKELTHLLNSVYSDGFLESDQKVKVFFTVNELHQMVVLQVNSENPEIQSYITKALNYKALSSNELKVGQDYVFDVNFKA
jgi:hypothetical protein